MRKIFSVLFCLVFLAACAAPVVSEVREWPGVPEAYWAVLDSPNYFPSPAASYALADINNDGVLELIMVGYNQELVGLFTQRDGEAVSLTVGGRGRFGLFIATDGTVFSTNHVSDGMNTIYMTSARLEPGAAELTQLTHHVLAHGEREDLLEAYTNPPNPMQFDFIPIERPTQ